MTNVLCTEASNVHTERDTSPVQAHSKKGDGFSVMVRSSLALSHMWTVLQNSVCLMAVRTDTLRGPDSIKKVISRTVLGMEKLLQLDALVAYQKQNC